MGCRRAWVKLKWWRRGEGGKREGGRGKGEGGRKVVGSERGEGVGVGCGRRTRGDRNQSMVDAGQCGCVCDWTCRLSVTDWQQRRVRNAIGPNASRLRSP